tara:strand:- start:99 stop:401 length:303 start_codon:yes stop_codon:yes gene_type:complete
MDLDILLKELYKLYGKKNKGDDETYSTSLMDNIKSRESGIINIQPTESVIPDSSIKSSEFIIPDSSIKSSEFIIPDSSINYHKCPYLNMVRLNHKLKSKL